MDFLSRHESKKTILKAMKALPSDLEGYYNEAIRRIKNQKEPICETVKKAMSFIFCARQDLTVGELYHALAVDDGDRELCQDAIPADYYIINNSAGLLRVDKESKKIRLAHHTLQEYLVKHPDALLPDPDTEIARACLTYLSFDVFGSGPCGDGESLTQRLQDYQFLEYASHHWGCHMRKKSSEHLSLILQYLDDSLKLSSSIQVLHVTDGGEKDRVDRFPARFGPLHVGAYWGLENLLNALLDTDMRVDTDDSHGETALLIAAKRGNYEAAQTLLTKGAYVDAQNHHGETALHLASKNNHEQIVGLLLKEGASIVVDDENWTALNWAVVNNKIELLTMLLEQYTDFDIGNIDRDRALFLAAHEGHKDIVKKLLDNGVNVDAKDETGSTALDFAVSAGHKETVNVLLENDASVIITDDYENSVLHWAVTWEEIARLLLEKGAFVQAKNNSDQTALCWTAQSGTVAVARLLLQNNADVNWQDQNGCTALHRASMRGCKEMIQLLLENGADANLNDKDRWTPLHGACVREQPEIIRHLLGKVNCGSTIVDSVAKEMRSKSTRARLIVKAEEKAKGSTVLTGLRYAAQEGEVGRLQMMLGNGAEVNGKEAAGYTALELASFHGHRDAVQLLLENKADINLHGSDGCPPLYYAIEQGKETVVSLLLDHGADVNARIDKEDGKTLVMLAAETENISITQHLIEGKADINARDYSGMTALHWAASRGRVDMMRLLLENQATLDTPDCQGNTALMLAIGNLQYAAVVLLLNKAASVKVKRHDSYSALDIASILGDQAMIELLEHEAENEAATSGKTCIQ